MEQLVAAYDYLHWIFSAQARSCEVRLRVSSLVDKINRDDRNVLCSYQQMIYPKQNADYIFSDWRVGDTLSSLSLPEGKPCLYSL